MKIQIGAHVHNIILLLGSLKQKPVICDDMNGPGECDVKSNKSNTKRQKVPAHNCLFPVLLWETQNPSSWL